MNNHCKQQLEKFGIKVEDITHVCIAHNYFPLLQYILLMPDDIVWHHTYYFVNDYLPVSMRDLIPCSSFIDGKTTFIRNIEKRINKLSFRFLKYFRYPFLKDAKIYAYDIPYFNILIGKREYSLLADAPNWLTFNMQEHSVEYQRQIKRASSFLGKCQKIVYGDIFINYFGRSNQCKTIYLTEENHSPVLKNKEVIINSLDTLWENASEEKKVYIKKMFGISEEDVHILNSRPIIFFSQPLITDCGLSEEENVNLHKRIFSNYPNTNIIIKTHPRDTFDYHKYFPDIIVYNKKVNSQLLLLVGIQPQKIVTVCSSAIETFPETIPCDYYGTKVHPKIEKYFGPKYLPNRKVNYVSC